MPIQQERDIRSELDNLPELIPLPDVALNLLDACNNANIGARELCSIVSCDTSLSVRLLQVSNSSHYGLSGQIKTVEHAAVVLGASGLRDLAMSIVAYGVFARTKAQNRDVESLWRHSLGCATVARTVAEHLGDVCPNEAFVTGMIHDVGKLVLVQLLKDDYDLVPRALKGEVTVDQEQQQYGIGHAELGRRCVEEWGLPPEIGDTLLSHHDPGGFDQHSRLTSVVVAANQLSKIWNIGNSLKVDMDPVDVLSSTELPLNETDLANPVSYTHLTLPTTPYV